MCIQAYTVYILQMNKAISESVFRTKERLNVMRLIFIKNTHEVNQVNLQYAYIC